MLYCIYSISVLLLSVHKFFKAVEQDIASRQGSISAMKDKVKKFVETADPSAAALLQARMDALSNRFTDACHKHKQKLSHLEQLKEKVEQFEKAAEKVQQFVVKRSQDMNETDGPGKTFNELSQLMQVIVPLIRWCIRCIFVMYKFNMSALSADVVASLYWTEWVAVISLQDTKAEMAAHASDLEKLQTLSKELSDLSPDGNKSQIQSKMDNISNIFSTFKDTVREK